MKINYPLKKSKKVFVINTLRVCWFLLNNLRKIYLSFFQISTMFFKVCDEYSEIEEKSFESEPVYFGAVKFILSKNQPLLSAYVADDQMPIKYYGI